MFKKLIEKNFIYELKKKGSKFIKLKRNTNLNNINFILEFCKGKDCIVVYMNSSDAISIEYKIMIFVENPFLFGRDITNLLFNKGLKYVGLFTIIKDIEYRIRILNYTIVELYKIEIFDLMPKVKVDDIYYFLPNINLINIYKILYNPTKVDQWENTVIFENNLINKFIDKKVTKYYNIKTFKTDNFIFRLKNKVIDYIKNKPQLILIGGWVFNIIYSSSKKDNIFSKIKTKNYYEKIQVISTIDILQVFRDVKKRFDSDDEVVIYKTQNIRIPLDLYIKKITLYLKTQTTEVPFMDIYNSGTYELIPFIHKNEINIANIFVILRFLFIDLWVLIFLYNKQFLKKNIYIIKKTYIESLIFFVRNNSLLLNESAFINNYGGVNIMENILKKQYLIKTVGEMMFPYFPMKRKTINQKI